MELDEGEIADAGDMDDGYLALQRKVAEEKKLIGLRRK
jgi:hypothetical protein